MGAGRAIGAGAGRAIGTGRAIGAGRAGAATCGLPGPGPPGFLPGCAHAAPLNEVAAIVMATTIVDRTARNLTIDLHSGNDGPIQRASAELVSRVWSGVDSSQ